MSIVKDGKEYEYNIDGDLVPKGSCKRLGSGYGDFKNRYIPKKEGESDSDWNKSVDRLFLALDPKNGASQEESDKAVDEFFEEIDSKKDNKD